MSEPIRHSNSDNPTSAAADAAADADTGFSRVRRVVDTVGGLRQHAPNHLLAAAAGLATVVLHMLVGLFDTHTINYHMNDKTTQNEVYFFQ